MDSKKSLKYEKALEYEIFVKEEYSFAKDIIREANCIFDIGGHIGFFSKWSRGLNPFTKIYFFEPIKQNYLKALEILGGDENIVFQNIGIASKNHVGKLLFNSLKTMQSSSFKSFLNPHGEEEIVEFVSFNDVIRLCGVQNIDLVKIDIEGMEFEVLSCLHDDNWRKINNLIVEIHLLNLELKNQWKVLYHLLTEKFSYIEIIPSGYNENIFLLWAKNNGIN